MQNKFVRKKNANALPLAMWQQIVTALALGLAIAFMGLLVFVLGFQVVHAGRIFPGVSVAGVDVSGMKPDDAAAKLSLHLTYPYSGRILFRDGERAWLAVPSQLGMFFDPNASAQAAFALGRSGGLMGRLNSQLGAGQTGIDLPPVMKLDQRISYAYLQHLTAEVNQPVVEAYLEVQGLEVSAQPGQVGRSLDIESTLVFLSAQLQAFRDGEVQLVVREQQPEILDVSAQAEIARKMLSTSLVITLPDAQPEDPGPWQIEPQILASMLRVERSRTDAGAQYNLALDAPQLYSVLEEIARAVNRAPENARFVFNDTTLQLDILSEALVGRRVDVEKSFEGINAGILSGQQINPLVVQVENPAVMSDATSEQLGVTELVNAYTSYFRGSSTSRLQNIKAAAARFHGVLVPPGATFSMGEVMGDISLDNGFAEALIIFGGRTIKGVGGGVCQVSTTLYRSVFFAGFPIQERYAHAYRVSYYEQNAGGVNTNLAGLDATVYFPLVDFKFVNDTPYWLLMETYYNPRSYSLTWKLYSTKDGRTVEWGSNGLKNIVPAPDPLFKENAELSAGKIRQVDWAAEGGTVDVWRKVYRNGETIQSDSVRTRYQPWQAIYEYGPGTEDPESLVP